ncbi:PREDICTED: complement receptor type 2-like [Priapulus caudatus]|uniref:Complement receptor type 2-like n=1 Tax=Priapulus caudatus TaxID=37621 RepID=A0ABM1F1C9_PRICU|nr:PREDICTED: complement receptor type 2-like [Priapulus caudatus]
MGEYDYRSYIRKTVIQGKQIRYACNKSYKVKNGPPGATCVHGEWRPRKMPVCEPEASLLEIEDNESTLGDADGLRKCDHPGNPVHGELVQKPGVDKYHYLVGDILEFRCNEGYRLIGKSHIKCKNNGQWSREVPRCEGMGRYRT